MKIRPVGAELLHVDWRTDGRADMKLIASFRNLAQSPNKPNLIFYVKGNNSLGFNIILH